MSSLPLRAVSSKSLKRLRDTSSCLVGPRQLSTPSLHVGVRVTIQLEAGQSLPLMRRLFCLRATESVPDRIPLSGGRLLATVRLTQGLTGVPQAVPRLLQGSPMSLSRPRTDSRPTRWDGTTSSWMPVTVCLASAAEIHQTMGLCDDRHACPMNSTVFFSFHMEVCLKQRPLIRLDQPSCIAGNSDGTLSAAVHTSSSI